MYGWDILYGISKGTFEVHIHWKVILIIFLDKAFHHQGTTMPNIDYI